MNRTRLLRAEACEVRQQSWAWGSQQRTVGVIKVSAKLAAQRVLMLSHGVVSRRQLQACQAKSGPGKNRSGGPKFATKNGPPGPVFSAKNSPILQKMVLL